jgi:hypothetical protein
LRNPTNPALDGSFDPTGRTAPTATRMEGLLAALEFIPNGTLRSQIESTVDHGVAFLLRTQIRGGAYAGGIPAAYASENPEAVAIRIDFVQHTLCALLRYDHLLQKQSKRSISK